MCGLSGVDGALVVLVAMSQSRQMRRVEVCDTAMELVGGSAYSGVRVVVAEKATVSVSMASRTCPFVPVDFPPLAISAGDGLVHR